MKKIIFLSVLGLFIAFSANAGTCNSGSIITAKNGSKYCISTSFMNWWSAFSWCESQGRTLADFNTLCPTTSGSVCPNMAGVSDGNYFAWTSTVDASNNAIGIYLNSGTFTASTSYYGNDPNAGYIAICK